ncbi:hypothetical protein L1987_22690 [Smallanthus sonchifolius]|uniref:Uncharacterized protein n=1 Tax=Smallanthus sonchifolius TaxID=185202 RepID=A0ACB9IFI6_9ASTR|nr:hypothetical protein L1987_22690 [Smallanthus sonchifolius]
MLRALCARMIGLGVLGSMNAPKWFSLVCLEHESWETYDAHYWHTFLSSTRIVPLLAMSAFMYLNILSISNKQLGFEETGFDDYTVIRQMVAIFRNSFHNPWAHQKDVPDSKCRYMYQRFCEDVSGESSSAP